MTPIVDRQFSKLRQLETKLGHKWTALEKARTTTDEEFNQVERLLLPGGSRPLAENVSLVVFGSLARGECTSLSDLDWTLLINGEVDGSHFNLFQSIRKQLREAKKIEPGATGVFGGMASSHELVHCIGGQDDTNKNLTLRMLLLLESRSIGDDEARQMVIRAILKRYLADDPHWTWKPDQKIPRFLLNDVIRFWRTMAVDFADKFHDQEGEKWALRNAKLRFSRKILLLTGMLACFSWSLRRLTAPASSQEGAVERAIQYFESYFSRPPLEILADELLESKAPEKLCVKIFSAYDRFLSIMDEQDSRNELVEVPRESADKSEVFQSIRVLSHEFRDGLLDWLYAPETPLCELVKQYGLF